MLTAAPGLERVAAEEASEKTGAEIRAVMRGKIFVSAGGAFDYGSLRCADNVYEYLQTLEVGRTRGDLNDLKSLPPRAFENAASKINRAFKINASVAGRHNYNRFEAAAAFAEALRGRFGFERAEDGECETELRLDAVEGTFLLSRKLTGAEFRFRGSARIFSRAAIRPTVAHALARLTRPEERDVFLDPFCGSGTILCERAEYPFKEIIGADKNKAAVEAAESNFNPLPQNIKLICRGIEDLALPPCGVDAVATNPPWDMQIETGGLFSLYNLFLKRCGESLSQNGRVVALTPHSDAITAAAENHGFTIENLCAVSLHGTLCGVYKIVRRSSFG